MIGLAMFQRCFTVFENEWEFAGEMSSLIAHFLCTGKRKSWHGGMGEELGRMAEALINGEMSTLDSLSLQ